MRLCEVAAYSTGAAYSNTGTVHLQGFTFAQPIIDLEMKLKHI